VAMQTALIPLRVLLVIVVARFAYGLEAERGRPAVGNVHPRSYKRAGAPLDSLLNDWTLAKAFVAEPSRGYMLLSGSALAWTQNDALAAQETPRPRRLERSPAAEGEKQKPSEERRTLGGRPHFEPMEDRWAIEPPPYEINNPGSPLNSYRQNKLKGDYPIIGDDVFLNLTGTELLLVEGRRLPTPTGIAGASSGTADFFGDGEQFFLQNFLIGEVDLFKGQQGFKPVDWRLKSAVVYNSTYLDVQETGVVNINVRKGKTRYSDYVALQEALAEVHLFDLSDRYDFLSIEAGILPFRSDFRGFVFDDVNLGVRLLGNADENKWQYNVTAFDILEKDTNSGLNRLQSRDQYVVIANLFRQDWPFLGYTTSLSFHYNRDNGDVEFDRNGLLVRPTPAGSAAKHTIDAYYLGWAGDGRIGPVNLTHAFYQVLGNDSENPFAARETRINAQFGALELSYDIDWLRPRVFGLIASGDDDPRDSSARGFDSINDAPNFAGGQVSFLNRNDVRLLGVNLTQRLSPLVNLRTSKLQGQSNFVNPGLLLIGGALDVEIAPRMRAMVGGSYLQLVATETLETFLEVENVSKELGVEVFFATQYRPFLNNNVIFNFGASPFFPGAGFKKIYQSSEVLFTVFLETIVTW